MAMDADLRATLEEIKRSISAGHGSLSGKLDVSNAQFNDHLKSDAVAFNTLQIGQKQIETRIEAADRRRKEESERMLQKQTEERGKKLQWRIALIGGVFAIIAALGSTLLATVLTYVEAKAARAERLQEKLDEKAKVKGP